MYNKCIEKLDLKTDIYYINQTNRRIKSKKKKKVNSSVVRTWMFNTNRKIKLNQFKSKKKKTKVITEMKSFKNHWLDIIKRKKIQLQLLLKIIEIGNVTKYYILRLT
jgi:hypothetical protein